MDGFVLGFDGMAVWVVYMNVACDHVCMRWWGGRSMEADHGVH
jgi:hypothetical protein